MAKNSLRILKDVLLHHMKMAKATRKLPTPRNWVAAQWLRSSSILKERGPLRTGCPKKLSTRAERHIQTLSLEDQCRSLVSIAAEIEEVGGVSLLVLRPYAALYIKLMCMVVTPGGSLFWRRYTRKPPNSLLKTCQQSTWITGTMSYGMMRWRSICLVLAVTRWGVQR